jgi:hypothetical protein
MLVRSIQDHIHITVFSRRPTLNIQPHPDAYFRVSCGKFRCRCSFAGRQCDGSRSLRIPGSIRKGQFRDRKDLCCCTRGKSVPRPTASDEFCEHIRILGPHPPQNFNQPETRCSACPSTSTTRCWRCPRKLSPHHMCGVQRIHSTWYAPPKVQLPSTTTYAVT